MDVLCWCVCSYVEALVYLIYSFQFNKELLSKGQYRGHDEKLITHYRRECLLVSAFLGCHANNKIFKLANTQSTLGLCVWKLEFVESFRIV